MNKLIFVSGTGRSGTHLVGRSLSSHEDIQGRIEDPSTFNLITKIATTQDLNYTINNFFLKGLLKYKLKKIIKKSTSDVLEKSHPSLWLTDFLIKEFENSYFIGVYRDVEPTVSSMLEHNGVLSWYSKLPQNKSNRFLGINASNVETFKKLSLEEKCALRWLSHKNELFRMKDKYPDRIILIKYDDFLRQPDPYLSKIATFLNVSDSFSPEKFNIDSLDKWKNKLSKEQLKLVYKAI